MSIKNLASSTFVPIAVIWSNLYLQTNVGKGDGSRLAFSSDCIVCIFTYGLAQAICSGENMDPVWDILAALGISSATSLSNRN